MKININSDKGNILTTEAYNLFSFRNVLRFATCYENKKSAKHYFDNFGSHSVKRLARLLLINREQTKRHCPSNPTVSRRGPITQCMLVTSGEIFYAGTREQTKQTSLGWS